MRIERRNWWIPALALLFLPGSVGAATHRDAVSIVAIEPGVESVDRDAILKVTVRWDISAAHLRRWPFVVFIGALDRSTGRTQLAKWDRSGFGTEKQTGVGILWVRAGDLLRAGQASGTVAMQASMVHLRPYPEPVASSQVVDLRVE